MSFSPLPPSPFPLRWAAWIALLLVAYALRLHHLDFESFWIDEATSLSWVRATLEDVALLLDPNQIAGAYWLILGAWTSLTGTSDYAVRYASLIFGLLLAPLIFAVGVRLLDRPIAWIATVLAAGSSFLIYYAQEARTYSFLGFLSLVALYLLARGLARPRAPGWWAGYALSAALLPLTHVFGTLAVACHLAYLAGHLLRRLGPRAWLVLGPLAAVLLPLLAWRASLLSAATSWEGSPAELATRVAQRAIRDTSMWIAFPGDADSSPAGWGPAAALPLLAGLAGMAGEGRSGARGARLWLAATLVVLPLLARNLALEQFSVLSAPRYLMFVAPVFLLLVAAGVRWLGRLGRPVETSLVPALVVVSLIPWWQSHIEGTQVREDWRGMVRSVESRLQPGDISLFPTRQARAAYGHYSLLGLEVVTIEGLSGPLQGATLASLVGPFLGSGRQLVALSRPPFHTVPPELEEWLADRALKVEEWYLPRLALSRYLLEPFPRYEPAPMETLSPTSFAGNIALLGFDRLPDQGTALRLAFHWQARGPVPHPIGSTILLEDRDGTTWGASHDAPTHGFYPTTSWLPGQILRDERSVKLMPGTPAGAYTLRLGLWREDTREPVPVLNPEGSPVGAFATLGAVALDRSWQGTRPPVEAVRLEARVQAGPSLEAALLPETGLRPGQALPLTTFWRIAGPFAELRLALDLHAADGLRYSSPTLGLLHAASNSRPDDLLARQVTLVLPAQLPPGPARLVLHLSSTDGRPIPFYTGILPLGQEGLPLGSVEILPRPPSQAIPSNATRVEQAWQQAVSLAAFSIETGPTAGPGDTVSVTLYWSGSQPTDQSYKVFVHLLDAAGRLVAQDDSLPGRGARPTTGWLPGEIIADPHPVALPAALAPGSYAVAVGLYEPRSGRRLTRPGGSDLYTLGQIDVQ